jgi:hypothetical protein
LLLPPLAYVLPLDTSTFLSSSLLAAFNVDSGGYGGGQARKAKPKKKNKRRVSEKQRDTCKKHLNEVAQTYMREFGQICNKLDLVNRDTGNAEFDIHELEDEKAKKFVDFVKRKMKLIIKNRLVKDRSMIQETGAGGSPKVKSKMDLLIGSHVALPALPDSDEEDNGYDSL